MQSKEQLREDYEAFIKEHVKEDVTERIGKESGLGLSGAISIYLIDTQLFHALKEVVVEKGFLTVDKQSNYYWTRATDIPLEKDEDLLKVFSIYNYLKLK